MDGGPTNAISPPTTADYASKRKLSRPEVSITAEVPPSLFCFLLVGGMEGLAVENLPFFVLFFQSSPCCAIPIHAVVAFTTPFLLYGLHFRFFMILS